MSVVILSLAVAAPLLFMWLIVVSIPQAMHTRYRHELWSLRDELVDDILSGKVELSPAASRLLRSLYRSIEGATEHTMRHGLLGFATIGHHLGSAESLSDVVLGTDSVKGAERERLAEYLSRYLNASTRHLIQGSPSGWALVALLAVASLIRRPFRTVVEDAASADIAEGALRQDDVTGRLSTGPLARFC